VLLKGKAELSLCLIKCNTVKTCGGSSVVLIKIDIFLERERKSCVHFGSGKRLLSC